MYEKPEVSDDELEKFMNFDQVLVKRSALIRRRKIQYAVGGTAVVVVAVISGWIFMTDKELKELPVEEVITERIKPIEEEFIIVDSMEVVPSAVVEVQRSVGIAEDKERVSVQQPTTTNETVIDSEPVYVQSAPKDGYANLYSYFESELLYPEEAIVDSIQGTVTVHCIIGKDGKPKGIQIENSLGEVFDKEVIRIINNMPAWNPATLNQNPVESKISLPLSFKLKSTSND